MAPRAGPVFLPKDAELVGLWPDKLTIQTHQCLLPGTRLSFDLLLEGNPLHLTVVAGPCLVVNRDKDGFIYHTQVALDQIPNLDRRLITLFIAKGRGTPRLARTAQGTTR